MSISRIHRLIRLITLLRGRNAPTAADLADDLGVSKRTVFRDLNMLELAGVPYYHDEQAGGYRIAQTYFLPPVNLTLEEALAVTALVGQSRQLPLHDLMAEAASKIESVLPRAIQAEVARSADNIAVAWPSQAKHSSVQERFEQIRRAIGDRRRLRVTYVSFYERGQIVLELSPWRLYYFQRAWYVIGHSHEHREVRTLKLGRIKELAESGRAWKDPGDFSLDKHFGNAWGMIPEGREYRVRLLFSPKVGPNVAEVNWHRTQKTTFRPDAAVEFEAAVDGLNEITWWIMGYGDQVEVLAPSELRRRVGEMARSMADRNAGRPAKGAE